jgi:hypothetical protein
MATGTQGDPISFGIAAASCLRYKVMALQVVSGPAGNAEL